MDYYYSSTPGMSTRGRFSSRGGSSYRGGGRGSGIGESSYRGSRGGGYSSSRGSSPRGRGGYFSKYENSSSKYNSDGPRYGSRLEDSYRKPESSYGSNKDHSHHRSDLDLGRKRIRSDSYSQSQGAAGSRRSHEMEDYRGGGSRYSNSNSYSDSRSYSETRGVFKKPRISDYKPKEEYRGRKEISRSSVAMSKLRSLRGRTIRGRTIIRRGGDSFLARKRAALASSRTTSEILAFRKTKMLKLRRLRERARLRMAEEKAVIEDKKKEEAKAAEEKEAEERKKEDENSEARDDEEKKDKEKKEGEANDGDANSKDKEKSKKSEERVDFFRKPFMKLQCPQCWTKCITFKEYIEHLYQPTHVKAMREKEEQLKQTLTKMRMAQRANQKKVDEEDVSNMSTRSTFCLICKLNYSQDKSSHQSSEAHKKLKNFLQPYCTVCRIPFKSPMAYETHICSLEHMRKKNALDERLGKTKGSSLEYLDNFMVLDSVGSGDEVEDSKDEKTEEEGKKEKAEKKSDENMNLGVEFIRRVEVFYCEVCRSYLPRMSDHERVLRVHCRTKYHLRSYLRFGSKSLLEQIRGKTKKGTSEDELPEVKQEVNPDGEKKENENHEGGGEDEGGIDEKLWADVNDLLSQVEPEAKSDDEDEEEGGRFDRFKSNEKKENGEANAEEGTAEKENAAEATTETNAAATKEAA